MLSGQQKTLLYNEGIRSSLPSKIRSKLTLSHIEENPEGPNSYHLSGEHLSKIKMLGSTIGAVLALTAPPRYTTAFASPVVTSKLASLLYDKYKKIDYSDPEKRKQEVQKLSAIYSISLIGSILANYKYKKNLFFSIISHFSPAIALINKEFDPMIVPAVACENPIIQKIIATLNKRQFLPTIYVDAGAIIKKKQFLADQIAIMNGIDTVIRILMLNLAPICFKLIVSYFKLLYWKLPYFFFCKLRQLKA